MNSFRRICLLPSFNFSRSPNKGESYERRGMGRHLIIIVSQRFESDTIVVPGSSLKGEDGFDNSQHLFDRKGMRIGP